MIFCLQSSVEFGSLGGERSEIPIFVGRSSLGFQISPYQYSILLLLVTSYMSFFFLV